MQPAPKAFAEGRHLPAKHGKRQRCVRRASEMSSHRAACRRFLQPHSGTLTVSGNARMELHDEPCTDKMSSGHCPHSPERSHGHQSSCGSRRMRRRLADMGEKARHMYLCQNRKISRMRWVLGTLVGLHRFISTPMDVGRRPKTIAIEGRSMDTSGYPSF